LISITFHESISLLIILFINFICLLLTKLSMLIIPIPPSLIFKQHTFLSIWFGLLFQRNFQIKSFTGKHWLQKYDKKFGVDFFLCKCSDIKGLDMHPFQNTIKTLYKHGTIFLGSCSTESKNDVY
jgi:hypothetical protein